MTPYAQIKAVNWSSLKHLQTSPLLYRYRMDHPQPTKPGFIIGGAVHTKVLEPHLFDQRHAVFDGTRRGKEWDAWQLANPGKESLKPPELIRVGATAEAVASHRVAAQILSGGRREESMTWRDPETGLACKGRVDYITPRYVADLKYSARGIDGHTFPRTCAAYLYHAQVAWYMDGAIAAGKLPVDCERPYIVAAQGVEPYDVGVYQLTPTDVKRGRAIYRRLLKQLVQCTEAGMWPGAVPDIRDLNVPDWSGPVEDEEF